jgi:Fe-S cluster biogenesis protein NfuA
MSKDSPNCTRPENLGGRNPSECSPQQQEICHGKDKAINSKGEKMDSLKEKVESSLNKIRPSLVADGGNVELVDVKDGVVKVKLVGHCAGCPMSMMTLKNGIERMLKQEIPEVKQVVAA